MKKLRDYFDQHGISIEKVAEQTGYKPLYIRNLFYGSDKPNDKMRFRFLQAFPDLPPFLLYKSTEESVDTNGKSDSTTPEPIHD